MVIVNDHYRGPRPKMLLLGLFVVFLSVPEVLGATSLTLERTRDTPLIALHGTFGLKCNINGLREEFFDQQSNFIDFKRTNEFNITDVARFSAVESRSRTVSGRYEIRGEQQPNVYVVTLTVSSSIETDAGDYQCGKVEGGEWIEGSPAETIQWMQPPTMEYPKCSADTIRRTGEIELLCQTPGVPEPTIEWYRGNMLISRKQTVDITGYIYRNYVIVNKTEVGDSYECRYRYTGVEIVKRSCWIRKPVLTLIPSTTVDQIFMTGEDIQFTVVAHAQPQMPNPLQCEWEYEDTERRFSIVSEGTDSIMTIIVADAQPEMNGTSIRCWGRNFLGKTTMLVTLLVEDPQEENLTASVTSESLHITEGESMTLSCDIGFTPPSTHDLEVEWKYGGLTIDTRYSSFKDRFLITPSQNDLVLKPVTLDDHGVSLSCVVRFSKRIIHSREVRLVVRQKNDTLSLCPYTLNSPFTILPALLCLLGLVACIFIIYKVFSVICRRKRHRSKSLTIEHVGGAELRTSSFGSSISSEQHFERSDIVVNIPDKSGLLKRPSTIPSSRCLPSVPRSASLTPVHEYESTPRNETYSLIKNDIRADPKCPNDSSGQQAYMDMGRNREGNASPTSAYSDNISSMETVRLPLTDDIVKGAVGGVAPPLPNERVQPDPEASWYLEVKKTPNQFNDLEDLYRETAKSNVYIPADKQNKTISD